MKEYYTISEISRLYGIGVDSLRYYERIGALSPRRGENNYRLYSLKDIYRLNIIRDLLTLGFSVKQIGRISGPSECGEHSVHAGGGKGKDPAAAGKA